MTQTDFFLSKFGKKEMKEVALETGATEEAGSKVPMESIRLENY